MNKKTKVTRPLEKKPKKEPEKELENEHSDRKIHREHGCGSWAVVGVCEDGHTYAKSLDCGREWCEKCRESSLNRRLARWLPKAQKIKEMGYLVVTFPMDKRPRRAFDFQRFGHVITGILMRRGFARGLRRWHWKGDKSDAWNPHLNFLMDGGFLTEERLDSIKKAICETLRLGKVVVYYQYTQDVRKIVHWLKYVNRPTFLKKEWDLDMAEELYNFRNSGWWGKWDDGDEWVLPENEKKLCSFKKVEAGICPCCDKKIKWYRVLPVPDLEGLPGWLKIWDKVWQYKGPPENSLLYELFKDFARAGKTGASRV